MISIRCNGQIREVAPNTTIAALVEELGVADKKFAVEHNRQVVSRERLAQQVLAEGDEVNIVTLVGGG